MADAPIELVAYQPQWPTKFREEKQFLNTILRDKVVGSIEHVGSTAVPGLMAKPVIDIMVGVASLSASKDAIGLLSDNGYCYYPYKPEQMHWFCKPRPEYRTHHVHLIPYNSELWHKRLAFRDALRQHPQLAGDYARLKQRLAMSYRHDRDAYSQAKSEFILSVLRQANG
ncbi:GrpB family protein [Bowmanella sp. Y26]|uniref:GrpB family protein n=1 Tax=Bowmanella yangjiangensis TaxID=2811230 RepID=UPI001BDD8F22|nr:GrpB family protein [Bowmanella yangjiangensis]MBT1065097.1 GrpB family protein [Bowmanella yangjiangensis]